MKRIRFAVAAAALSAAAIGLPASSASAATTPAFALPDSPWTGLVTTDWAGLPTAALSVAGPDVGQVAAVVGPTIITTAPSTFINTNNQVTAGPTGSGGQASGTVAGVG
jgi:hypothetical protein